VDDVTRNCETCDLWVRLSSKGVLMSHHSHGIIQNACTCDLGMMLEAHGLA
jgi:hypothetical protein